MQETVLAIIEMIGIALLLSVLYLVPLLVLALFRKACFAVLKRNFIGYFSNPTGYVFLCAFVLLTSVAAFWPHRFFTSNMATLDQLNLVLPYIMLIFIPAITMSVWAEERREGTDELLLTIPAGDFDIALGKYLAATSIFTASLLYSMLANFFVLNWLALGGTDIGLFLTTYLGYWFMGLAMLAIGMVASFLTRNLTVGFILGAAFNAPLAFAAKADVIIPNTNVAQAISHWSLSHHFESFGRGVVSIASVSYFLLIAVVGFYVCLVLIGRRHWMSGSHGAFRGLLHAIAIVSLVGIFAGVTLIFRYHDVVRVDATSERIASLSPDTLTRIDELNLERPVYVEAYLSQTLPDQFVKTKYDIISLLEEFRARAGDKVIVNIHDDLEPFSEEARQAELRYGIRPVPVRTETHGAYADEQIYLAAVFSCGLERVVVPFIGPGASVEYELVRSLCTVARQSGSGENQGAPSRKSLGVLLTDAQMQGGIDFSQLPNIARIPQQAILDELEKQYKIDFVDPNKPIETDEYDVLLVVQPSSLTQPQLENLIAAIRAGQRTALFEDPAPLLIRGAPATDEPKRQQPGMMGMAPPEQKGNIEALWRMLGIRLVRASQGMRQPASRPGQGDEIVWQPFTAAVWQSYNPYPRVREFPESVVFANVNAEGGEGTFNSLQPAVSGLYEVAFMAPGALDERADSDKSDEAKKLVVTPLVRLGTDTSILSMERLRSGGASASVLLKEITDPKDDRIQRIPLRPEDEKFFAEAGRLKTGEDYVLAARIQSEELVDKTSADSGDSPAGIDVIVVSDIDVLDRLWISVRNVPDRDLNFQFQNVALVLNLLDVLAGDERFVNIRKRQANYASLRLIEDRVRVAETRTVEEIDAFEQEINELRSEAATKRKENEARLQAEVDELERAGQLDSRRMREARQKLEWQQQRNKEEAENEGERLVRRLRENLLQNRRELELDKLSIQNQIKVLAVMFPPIAPLFVGVIVFVARRLREREGVSKERLR